MAKKPKEYTGTIRDINLVRDFVRESFVYGLKTKSQYTDISSTTYDVITREMRDWFDESFQTRNVVGRIKVKYISLNCREFASNPLYGVWKSCSFTMNEIVFFFFLVSYLSQKKKAKLPEIYASFEMFYKGFSQSAAQKWLATKGCPSGIIVCSPKKEFSLAQSYNLTQFEPALMFYSEMAPVGVIGSYILDKEDSVTSLFRYKQHYIGQAFDMEIICNVLFAIMHRKSIELTYESKEGLSCFKATPIKVYSSTQNGRQYLFVWDHQLNDYVTCRLDRIKDIIFLDDCFQDNEKIYERFSEMQKHIWGVSLGDGTLIHVEFSLRIEENEGYILRRLNREKRCGKVSRVENQLNLFRFEADVYDAHEMFVWIRTFIGRIEKLEISDPELQDLFWKSVNEMYDMYSLGGQQV